MQALIAVARKLLHAIYGIFAVKHPTTDANSSPRSSPHLKREISPLDTPKEKKMLEVRERILPTLFGNPFGIPTSPQPRRLDICLLVLPKPKTIATARGL